MNPHIRHLGLAVIEQAWNDAFRVPIGFSNPPYDKTQAILFLASPDRRYASVRELWASAADVDADVIREKALARLGSRPLPLEPLAPLGRACHRTTRVERSLRQFPDANLHQIARSAGYPRSKVLLSLTALHDHGLLSTDRYNALVEGQ